MLIKDINLSSPNRAHTDILSELYLQRLIEIEGVTNFDTLHNAWASVSIRKHSVNVSIVSLEAWYEWAASAKTCKFPERKQKAGHPDDNTSPVYLVSEGKDLCHQTSLRQKGREHI